MAASYTPNINLAKPDRQDYVSVITDINNNMDKIDTKIGAVGNDSVQDQIDTLNSKVATSADTIVSNIAGVKTALTNFANAMNKGEAKLVRIVHVDASDNSIMRSSVRYTGYLTKSTSNDFSWLASGYLEKEPVIFSYYDGNQTWVADKLALNSNLGNFKQYINDYIGNNQTRTYTLEQRKIHLMSIATLGNGDVDNIYLAVVATPDNTSASGKIYWITDAPNSAISCTLSGFTLTVTTNGAWPIIAIMRM